MKKKKRELLTKARKARKQLSRVKAEKKHVSGEILRLSSLKNIFTNMSTEEARTSVFSQIKDVQPGDIYPNDLEKEFDKIDRQKRDSPQYTVDVNAVDHTPKIPARHGADDDDEVEMVGATEGVIDFSDFADNADEGDEQ